MNSTFQPEDSPEHVWPNPVGLCLGLLSVAMGQVFVLIYHFLRVKYSLFSPKRIQANGKTYEYWEGVTTHLSQPEGFVILVSYLSLTWMFNLMPSSYYSFEGGINWLHVLLQLLIQVCMDYTLYVCMFVYTCPCFCCALHWSFHVMSPTNIPTGSTPNPDAHAGAQFHKMGATPLPTYTQAPPSLHKSSPLRCLQRLIG